MPAVLVVVASITDPLVNFATDLIDRIGLAGIFVLMTLESACIPIPSEATMLFAGFNVAEGHYPLWQPVLVATLANVVGSWIAYGVGYYGRVDVLERHGRKIGIRTHHLRVADRWFERHGEATVFFSRLVPVVRTFISLPAGVARMPFWRFTLFTLLGCLPWMLLLTFVGQQVGDRWTVWKDHLHYVDYAVVVLIVLAAAYLVVRWYRRRGRPEGGAVVGEPTDAPQRG